MPEEKDRDGDSRIECDGEDNSGSTMHSHQLCIQLAKLFDTFMIVNKQVIKNIFKKMIIM